MIDRSERQFPATTKTVLTVLSAHLSCYENPSCLLLKHLHRRLLRKLNAVKNGLQVILAVSNANIENNQFFKFNSGMLGDAFGEKEDILE